MEDLQCIRSVRSNPDINSNFNSLLIAQRQMTASTPPSLNNETRLPLPEECYIPLPQSPLLPARHENEDGPEYIVRTSTGLPLPIPLMELLQAIQEDNYESRRLVSLQDEAHGLFHKCGSCDRFLTVQAQLYRSMMDCFRSDKKSAFASLYAKAMSYPAFGELRINGPAIDDELVDPSEIPWTDRLPPDSRSSVMDFLFRLRSDPDFVANRLSRLSSDQLKRLTRFHGPLEPGAIFRSRQAPGMYDGRNGIRGFNKSNDPELSVEDLLSDPLLLMIHGVFDRSISERSQQVDVWSSVCAKLLEEGKPGSDEFLITVLNIFIGVPEWTAIPKLELLLSELISQAGSFLEHPISEPKSTGFPQKSATTELPSLLDHYISKILDVLINNPVPENALDLVRMILVKITNPRQKLTARKFLFLRWYSASFLANAITYPENHGILLEHHISNSIRQKLLRELALRLQNKVSDFLSSASGGIPSNAIDQNLQKILSLFEYREQTAFHRRSQASNSRGFVFLRSNDVLAMARALTPVASPKSNTTSIFELAHSPSASFLAYQQSYMPTATDQDTTQSSSSPTVDSGYNSIDKGRSRPNVPVDTLDDSEKYGAMSFLHDLWTLDVGREYGSASSSKQELAVIFVGVNGRDLSLKPFETQTEFPIMEWIPPQRLSVDDQSSLTRAIMQLTNRLPNLQFSYSEGSFSSLAGIVALFQDQATHCNNSFDYQGEHFWWRCLQILQNTESFVLSNFITGLVERRKDKITRRFKVAKHYEDWLHALRGRSNVQDQENQKLSLRSKRLRNKMWFISDVRHSSAYEEAHNVVRALRAMLEQNEQRQSGVTGWAKQRFKSSFGQERALAQLLELMTAPKPYGGPNKLSENQVEITSGWLLHENIENFCRGEERIHRFCYEIQRCIKRLAGETMLDSPVLWSSPLYSNEKLDYGVTSQSTTRQQQDRMIRRMDPSLQQWQVGQMHPSSESLLPGANPSRQSFENSMQIPFQPPGNTMKMAGTNHGPRNWTLPPSPISPGNVKTSQNGASLQRRSFLQNLRIHLTSLLLSDLGAILWKSGSETDNWLSTLNKPKHQSIINGVVLNDHDHAGDSSIPAYPGTPISADFDFKTAYRILLQRFNLTSNPQNKLRYLHEFFVLVSFAQQFRALSGQSLITHSRIDHGQSYHSHGHFQKHPNLDRGLGLGVPRTRLTRLQEVAANCEDRRRLSISNSTTGLFFNLETKDTLGPHFDDPDLILAVQTIFEDPNYRPATFFRDLQYIAAFVPGSILDHTPQGTAFWTIGLAAMKIKSERCNIMTENAMQILDFHCSNGNKKEPIRLGQSSPSSKSPTAYTLTNEDLLQTSLKDAAQLLTKSALEGDPTAARELALFYLTHPELVSRVTLPLSRPSDVFRVKHGLASERGTRNNGIEEFGILDSVTFAVVFHWMEFAASAGDADAITFFKENQHLGTTL